MGKARDKALLIIDMQNDFVLKEAPLRVRGALDIVKNLQVALGVFRKNGFPIFHIVRVHRKDASDVELTRKDRFLKVPFAVEGTGGAAIIDELKPSGGEYVVKKIRMSAFLDTELDLMLKSLGIKSVVIAGVQTPNCIRTTVFDAIAYNYNAFIVEDATAAQTQEIHAANLSDMKNIGASIIKIAELERLLSL